MAFANVSDTKMLFLGIFGYHLENLSRLRVIEYSTEAQGGDYHLSGEFTGPTFSSSLFGVDFESGC